MSQVGWYYDQGGQQAGPVGQAELVELIRSGRVAPGTRVWRPGLAGWAAWETVAELAAMAAPPPPGPPPLSTQVAGADAPPHTPGWGPPPGAAGAGAPPFSGNSYAADVLTGAGAGALYPKAPLGGRFLAALVDALAMAPAFILGAFAVLAATTGSTTMAVLLGLVTFAAGLWGLIYAFTKDGRPGGQSFGKKMMGLMVVHLQTNQPCDRGQSALRYLVMFLLNLVPYIGWLIEPIVLLSAAGGRRLGDSAAGTQVIEATAYRARR
jgi:uncharacterized RDD family membrane protein YckC